MFKWLKTSVNKILSGSDSEHSLVHIDDDGFMDDDIQVNIEDIIAGEDNDDIGKLYVLSLTEFHTALGEMWDKREAKIFLLTEAVLRDYIGAGNRWEHRSKEVYVMLFPTLSQMDAEARTFDIAEQLGLKIIGERFDGARRPHIRFAGVDPKDALNEDGTLDVEALEKAGREGESAGDENAPKAGGDYKTHARGEEEPEHAPSNEQGPNWREKGHHSIKRPDKWKDNPHAHQDMNGNWHENEHAAHEANTNWKKGQRQSGMRGDPNWKEDLSEHHVGPSDDDVQWVSISHKDKAPTTEQATSAKSSYSLSFAPCWIRETQSLSCYKSLLNHETKDGISVEGPKAYAAHKTDEQLLKVDLWVLQSTAKFLFPMITKKIKTPVFVPVHSSSLRRPSFFDALNNFSTLLREDYFILEIIDDGQWDEKPLQELVTKIKEAGLKVALSPSPKHDFKAPLCQGLDWVGLDLSILDENSTLTEQRLNDLQNEITSIGAKFYVLGISKRAQLADMLNLGAALLSGPALVRTTKKLRPAFDLAIERLQKAAGS